MRYARERGGLVRTLAEQAAGTVDAVLDVVAKTHSPTHRYLDPVLESSLRDAYEAGRRAGEADERVRAGASMAERMRAALAHVTVEPPRCPHCHVGGRRDAGDPCGECGGTGNYRQP